jgi:hypothetical protein
MTLSPGDPNRPVAPAFDFLLGSERVEGSSQPPNGAGITDRPRREQRRRPRVDGRSLTIPFVITILIAALIGGTTFTGWTLVQSSEAQVKADSAKLCANIAETPGVLALPAFGWPTDGADLTTTLDLMKAYQVRWEAITVVAPPTIKADVKAVADAAAVITSGIETSKSIDRPATLTAMHKVTSVTVIPAWVSKYCG